MYGKFCLFAKAQSYVEYVIIQKQIELVNIFKHKSSIPSMTELHVLPEEPVTKQRL
jgi:hypothetical protein